MGKSLPCIALFLFTHSIFATTWYVSTTGNNANAGTSPGMAFATIQHAENQAGPGDSVIVANGSYAGFYVDVSGTSIAPIVFLADGNAVFITSPTTTTDGINVEGVAGNTVDHIEINGFNVNNMPRNGIRLVYADHCIIRNCVCDNNFERGIFTGFTDDILIEYNVCTNSNDEHGIYVSNSSDRSVIRYNTCHHNNRGGIQINADHSQGGDGISTDPEIYGNILYENGVAGGAAINLDGVQGAFIYNNLLYENHASGIALFKQDGAQPSLNATIIHNTIINASDGRWCILIVNGSTGAQVFNNIIINQHDSRGSIALDADAVAGFDSDYNIVVNSMSTAGDGTTITLAQWLALGYGSNSILADAPDDIFIDPTNGDYHLLTNSQPVDAGDGSSAAGVITDIEGNPRPTGGEHDIGAYEDQSVVLALEENPEEQPRKRHRWIDFEFEDDRIVIRGLADGDQICLYTISGKLVHEEIAAQNGVCHISLAGCISGPYVIAVKKNKRLIDSRVFIHASS